MDTLLIPCAAAMMLIFWLDSEAFVEYASIIGLSKILNLENYHSKRAALFGLTYPLFLDLTKSSFTTRLLSCYICLAFWINLVLSWFTSLMDFPVNFILSIVIYKIFKRL